jgi:hypothetical protein
LKVEIPTREELRQKNPFTERHFNLSFQGVVLRRYPEMLEHLKSDAVRVKAEEERRSKDKAMSWDCLIRDCPSIRSKLIELRKQDEAR